MFEISNIMVTIVTPTGGRPELLPGCYRVYASQDYEDRELLIYDDSPTPSDYMRRIRDPTVRYHHSTDKVCLGEKRDWLVREARGDIVVQFDDDDYYAPDYTTRMVRLLEGFDVVKLSGWFVVDGISGQLFYWDTSVMFDNHFVIGGGVWPQIINCGDLPDRGAWRRNQLYGYGFSYVFRKSVYKLNKFSGLDRGEDCAFLSDCEAAGRAIRFVTDYDGIAVHIVHRHNSSRAFPNYRLPWGQYGHLAERIQVREDVFVTSRRGSECEHVAKR
jgi:glycosyltransferase involved in cell wall biosynthesis